MVLFNNAILNIRCTFITSGSSNLAVLHPIICSILNSYRYWVKASLVWPEASVASSTIEPCPLVLCQTTFSLYQLTACQLLLAL